MQGPTRTERADVPKFAETTDAKAWPLDASLLRETPKAGHEGPLQNDECKCVLRVQTLPYVQNPARSEVREKSPVHPTWSGPRTSDRSGYGH